MLFVECAQREIMLKVVQMAYCCTIMHIKLAVLVECHSSHYKTQGILQIKWMETGKV